MEMLNKLNVEEIMSFSDLKLFALSSNRDRHVWRKNGWLGEIDCRQFSDEIQPTLKNQPVKTSLSINCSPVNDTYLKFDMVDALKASKNSSMLCALLWLCTSGRKAREPTQQNSLQHARSAGADHLLTIDCTLHRPGS